MIYLIKKKLYVSVLFLLAVSGSTAEAAVSVYDAFFHEERLELTLSMVSDVEFCDQDEIKLTYYTNVDGVDGIGQYHIRHESKGGNCDEVLKEHTVSLFDAGVISARRDMDTGIVFDIGSLDLNRSPRFEPQIRVELPKLSPRLNAYTTGYFREAQEEFKLEVQYSKGGAPQAAQFTHDGNRCEFTEYGETTLCTSRGFWPIGGNLNYFKTTHQGAEIYQMDTGKKERELLIIFMDNQPIRFRYTESGVTHMHELRRVQGIELKPPPSVVPFD